MAITVTIIGIYVFTEDNTVINGNVNSP